MANETKGVIFMLDKYETCLFIGNFKGADDKYEVHESMKGSLETLFKLIANAAFQQAKNKNSEELPVEFKLIRDAINAAEKILWTKKD